MKIIELVDKYRSLAILSIKIVMILSEGYSLTITLEDNRKIIIRGAEEEIKNLKTTVLSAWGNTLNSNSMPTFLKIYLSDYGCKIADYRI